MRNDFNIQDSTAWLLIDCFYLIVLRMKSKQVIIIYILITLVLILIFQHDIRRWLKYQHTSGLQIIQKRVAPLDEENGTSAVSTSETKGWFKISTHIEDKRRLGNLMFNYASLLGIAKQNNMEPICRPHWIIHEAFQVKMRQERDLEKFGKFTNFFAKRGTDLRTKALPRKNIMLHGFFQSWKYFEKVEDKLRKHFVFHLAIATEADAHLERIMPIKYQNSTVLRIGIHVRRGLLYKNPKYTPNLPNSSYYLKAMNYFRQKYKNVVFIVCSDAIGWSRANVKGPDVVYSGHPSGSVDLAILASCDHIIITLGTYGWWAAWFVNGTTVYYNWFHDDRVYDMVNTWQYFKPDWIPMW